MSGHAKQHRRWISGSIRLLGVALFAWILWQLDWRMVQQSVMGLHAGYLMIYVLLFCLMMALRILRVGKALARQGHHVSLGLLYRFTIEAGFLAAVTPGRVGEVVKIGFLKGAGVPFSRSLIIVLVERGYDAFFLMVTGGIGIFYFSAFYYRSAYSWAVAAAIALGLVIPAFFLLYRFVFPRMAKKLGPLMRRWVPAIVADHWSEIRVEFPSMFSRIFGVMTAYSLILVVVNIGQVYFLAKAFGMDIGFFYIGFAYAVATVVTLLPISVSGLGTREACYIFLLGLAGISPEAATLFSLFDGVIFTFAALFVMVLPIWFRKARYAA
ncbi:MAG: flippase-like domain-containing protein [Sulfuricella sp.]|nr:flippase-like domain-containing protein [Sulfuricella sp.]